VPNFRVAAGIQAVRAMIPVVWFNIGNPHVVKGLERLEAYHYEWDDEAKVFSSEPAHDENSHPADGFRMLALSKSVTEHISRNRTTVARGPTHFNTPLGRALNLENLFKDREEARTYRRI